MSDKLKVLKKQGLFVFLDILRLHRKKLPIELRSFGDVYVKQEFRQHQDANSRQYEMFLEQWQYYLTDLKQMKDVKQIGKKISEEDKLLLNDDQMKTLSQLEEETKKTFKKQ
ncbi:hypothetical protein ABPG72_020419 [Tetrahymena utriculariae]